MSDDREPVPGYVRSEPLYALGDALSAVMEEIEGELAQNDGELTDEMAERLSAAEGAWEDKVVRVGLYAKGLLRDVKAIKAERARLAKRAAAAKKYAAWLADKYLAVEMAKHGRDKVRGALATVRLQLNNPAAEATTDLEFLDPRWVRRKVELTLDREAVLAAWRAKEQLPEGVRVTRATSVRIA